MMCIVRKPVDELFTMAVTSTQVTVGRAAYVVLCRGILLQLIKVPLAMVTFLIS
jgi:hypothetical protein